MNARFPDRFDIVMANLKPLETTVAFDLEFRRRLEEAVARKYRETVFDALARRAAMEIERLREALVPRTPVPIRVMAALLFVMSAGLYIYSTQPALPVAINVEGSVTVLGRGETLTRALALYRGLKPGDMIATGEDSQLDINLIDRYTIRVKPGTTFRVARLPGRLWKGTVDLRLASGNMLVDIEKGFKGSKFVVTTDAGTAGALGTKFSVSSSRKEKPRMDVDVLEGRVAVKSSFRPAGMLLARQTVMVGPGQKTEVTEGDIPTPPRRLLEADWRKLEELYQIGRKPQVILLLKNTPDRVRQLLAPCPIYISDNEPRELPRELEEAVKSIGEAINTGETARHIQAIKLLEKMAKDHPHAKYNAQLSLYLGSYYEFLGRHEEAIRTFKDVVARYPESQFAGMAQCAIGIIYEDKLSDPVRAGEVFRAVLKYYPDSLEALWVEEKLSEKKTI